MIVREVPTEVDTAAILADYFSNIIADTIIERPYLKVELTDVISRNSLLDRTVVSGTTSNRSFSPTNALALGLEVDVPGKVIDDIATNVSFRRRNLVQQVTGVGHF